MNSLNVNTIYSPEGQIPLAYVAPAVIDPDEAVIFNPNPPITEKLLDLKVDTNWNAAGFNGYPTYNNVISGTTSLGSVVDIEVYPAESIASTEQIFDSCSSGSVYITPYALPQIATIRVSGHTKENGYATGAVTKSGNNYVGPVLSSRSNYFISSGGTKYQTSLVSPNTYNVKQTWGDANDEFNGLPIDLPNSFTARFYNTVPTGLLYQGWSASYDQPLDPDYIWTIVNLDTAETSAHEIDTFVKLTLSNPITVIEGQEIVLEFMANYPYGLEPTSAVFTEFGLTRTPNGTLYGALVRMDSSGSFGISAELIDQTDATVAATCSVQSYVQANPPAFQDTNSELYTVSITVPAGVTQIKDIKIKELWTNYYDGFVSDSLMNPITYLGMKPHMVVRDPHIKSGIVVRKNANSYTDLRPDVIYDNNSLVGVRSTAGNSVLYYFPVSNIPSGDYNIHFKMNIGNANALQGAQLVAAALEGGQTPYSVEDTVYRTPLLSEFAISSIGLTTEYDMTLSISADEVATTEWITVGVMGLDVNNWNVTIGLPEISTVGSSASKIAKVFTGATISGTHTLANAATEDNMRIKLTPIDALPTYARVTLRDTGGTRISSGLVTFTNQTVYTTLEYTTSDALDYGPLSTGSTLVLECSGCKTITIEAETAGKLGVSIATDSVAGIEPLLDTPLSLTLKTQPIVWDGIKVDAQQCWSASFTNGLLPRLYELNEHTAANIISAVSGYFMGRTWRGTTTGTIASTGDMIRSSDKYGQQVVLFYSLPEIAETTLDGRLELYSMEPAYFNGLTLYTNRDSVTELKSVTFISGSDKVVATLDYAIGDTNSAVTGNFDTGVFKFNSSATVSGKSYATLKNYPDKIVEYTYSQTSYSYYGYGNKRLDLNPKTGHFISTDGDSDEVNLYDGAGGLDIIHSAELCKYPVYFSLRPSYCCAIKDINTSGQILLGYPAILEQDIYLRHHIGGIPSSDPDFAGDLNDNSGLILGSVTVAKVSTSNRMNVVDARIPGGGTPEGLKTEYDDFLWDTGGWDGTPVTDGGKVVVTLPSSVLERFTEDEVREVVKRYVAAGVVATVEFV